VKLGDPRIADSSSTKRTQLSLRTHNETLSITAMCVCDKDCSPVRIYR
jgi:hypothetical protein